MSDPNTLNVYNVAHQAVGDLVSTILADVGVELQNQYGISQDHSQRLFHNLLESYGITNLRIRKRAVVARKKKETVATTLRRNPSKPIEWLKIPVSGWDTPEFAYTTDVPLHTGYPVWSSTADAVVATFDGTVASPLSSDDMIAAMRNGITVDVSYIQ